MDPPNTDSVRIMQAIDCLPADMRALVHVYGFSIVYSMMEEGCRDAKALLPILETWRQRRQEQQCRISD